MLENTEHCHKRLAERILQHGPITVAEYMQDAVETYYKLKNPFGADGDFITAPDISQMFGEMIGAWLVDTWLQMGRPSDVQLIELGPGRGTLASDIMRTTSVWPDFKSAITLHLVETSPRLRDIQAEALKDYPVKWYDSLIDVPQGTCFIIANEFFDALPIHQFQMMDGAWQERCIGYEAAKNTFIYTHAKHPPLCPPPEFDAPYGAIYETSPISISITEEISKRITRHNGAALIIDYGHAHAGFGDTLQAVSKHNYANVLEKPGDRDITAHVDFSALKTAAQPFAQITGPVTQGQFLIAMGIEARSHALCEKANNKQRQRIMEDLCRLVAPREMGRLFKVMGLTAKNATIRLAGFEVNGDENTDDRSG